MKYQHLKIFCLFVQYNEYGVEEFKQLESDLPRVRL